MRHRAHVLYLNKIASGGLARDRPFSTGPAMFGSILNRLRLNKNDLCGCLPVIQPKPISSFLPFYCPQAAVYPQGIRGRTQHPPARWGQSFRVGIRKDADLRSYPYLVRNTHRRLEGIITYIDTKI
jgi:hypothetical protein